MTTETRSKLSLLFNPTDIDECQSDDTNNCDKTEHFECLNTDGNYRCVCAKGYSEGIGPGGMVEFSGAEGNYSGDSQTLLEEGTIICESLLVLFCWLDK